MSNKTQQPITEAPKSSALLGITIEQATPEELQSSKSRTSESVTNELREIVRSLKVGQKFSVPHGYASRVKSILKEEEFEAWRISISRVPDVDFSKVIRKA